MKEKGTTPDPPVLRFDGGRLSPFLHRAVLEHPVALTVNGRLLATLIASPHDLPFLVAGFLRMQGLVETPGDILSLGVCPDSGAANVRIRKEVPPALAPVLTSGCGGGVSFSLPGPSSGVAAFPGVATFTPDAVFAMMDGLSRLARGYQESGGIHSAAAGDGEKILVFAEDIGRHNTLDRIAGEALLKRIDLSGSMIVTSGRVSSEMAAKAAALGAALVASRTSPTDLAVRICRERGIGLLGYVRGRRFNVYANPGRLSLPPEEGKIEGVAGVILAGGASSRMGCDKALLPWQGGRFIDSIHRKMDRLFDEVLLVTNTPGAYDFVPCRKVPDLFPGAGSLAGIHSGLHHAAAPYAFVVACDMPYLDGNLIRRIAAEKEGHDAVVPEGEKGMEPLHALYAKTALPAIEAALLAGQRRVLSFLDKVRVRTVSRGEVARVDPLFCSFRNINTPEDYYRFRESERAAADRQAEGPFPVKGRGEG
jgi:FdhD protein